MDCAGGLLAAGGRNVAAQSGRRVGAACVRCRRDRSSLEEGVEEVDRVGEIDELIVVGVDRPSGCGVVGSSANTSGDQVSDEDALPCIYDLLKDEGICVGGSAGVNIVGAVRLAQELGPGHTIVTILCDSGARYQSKLFNPEFLWQHKLPYPQWIVA